MIDLARNNYFSEFKLDPPAQQAAIDAVQVKLSFRLPDGYVRFLRFGNGGEGAIGASYARLWPVENLIEWNVECECPKWLPMMFIFGSTGGGSAFALDTRTDPMRIVRFEFVAMFEEYVVAMSHSFDDFFEALWTGRDM